MDDVQESANDRLWSTKNFVRKYAHTQLRPAEATILQEFGADLTGRVLELGCGAGRVTGHMGELSDDVLGIDLSAQMVRAAREAYPAIGFEVGDVRDLECFADGSFDVVAGWCNIVDVLNVEHRDELHAQAQRLLSPSGLFLLSTHNLAGRDLIRKPTELRYGSPVGLAVDLVRLPGSVRNRRRLRCHERTGDGYAILNDISHHYLALHYYVTRAAAEQQLADHGFDVLCCVGHDGARLADGDAAPASSDLHFVARRRA